MDKPHVAQQYFLTANARSGACSRVGRGRHPIFKNVLRNVVNHPSKTMISVTRRAAKVEVEE